VNLPAGLQELTAPCGGNFSGGVVELVKRKFVVGYQSFGDRRVNDITSGPGLPCALGSCGGNGLRRQNAAAAVDLGPPLQASGRSGESLFRRRTSVPEAAAVRGLGHSA
jgi:hypothetical protein